MAVSYDSFTEILGLVVWRFTVYFPKAHCIEWCLIGNYELQNFIKILHQYAIYV